MFPVSPWGPEEKNPDRKLFIAWRDKYCVNKCQKTNTKKNTYILKCRKTKTEKFAINIVQKCYSALFFS